MVDLNSSDPTKLHCYKLFSRCISGGLILFRNVDWCNKNCTSLHHDCPSNLTKPCIDSQATEARNVLIELPTILLVTFILISVSSFLANGVVCAVYILSKNIRTAKHYFIVNLAIADILMALFGIPFYLTRYTKHKTLCKYGAMVEVLCCTSSIVSFTAISVERFVAVKYPLRYSTMVTHKRCLIALCFVWGYSIANALASRIPVGKFYDECVFFTNPYLYFSTFSSFLLPFFAMVVIYGWIYKVAKKQARQLNYSFRGHSAETGRQIKLEFKAAKTLTLIIGAFVVSWIPLFLYIWIFHLYEETPPFDDLHYIVEVARYLNGLANPFIYVGINREFRHSTFKIFKKILPHQDSRWSSVTSNEITSKIVLRENLDLTEDAF